MKRSILITLLTTCLLLLVAGAYWMFFTPQAQAKRLAQDVMRSAHQQDDVSFQQYGDTSGEFFDAASQRNYRLDSFVQEKTTFYIRYIFTDSQSPSYARIAIQNSQVIKLATGDALGRVPSDDHVAETHNTDSSEFCLEKADLEPLDATRLYARTVRGVTMIFGDNRSIDYVDTEQSSALLDRVAKFYTESSEKDFSFLLRGYLPASSEQTDLQRQVIDNRTTKIQQDLVDRGISRDRTNIGAPIAYDASLADKSNNDRYIVIDVVNHCID